MGFSSSDSESQQQVFPEQQAALGQIYQGATGALPSDIGPIRQTAQRLAGRFLPGLEAAATTAAGIASGGNPIAQFLQQRATADPSQNPALQGAIRAVSGDINRNLTETLLPAIGGGAELAGARGSARQGIAEGLAIQGAQRESTRAATDLVYGDYLAQAEIGSDLLRTQLAAGQTTAQLPQEAINLGLAPYTAPFQPYLAASTVVGRPAVIGQSESSGFGLDLGALF